MTYVLGLVGLLVFLAGVIAYAGDRLGTWVGRRRLTLFGARPKRTGQIVGVAAGILIMLTTLGVLALAFRNATQTLVNAQRTADELGRLRGQERFLQEQVGALGEQLQALEADLAQARAVIGEAEAARDAALADRDALLEEAQATEAQLEALAATLEAARGDLDGVETELLAAQADLTAATEEAASARADADAARAEVDALEAQIAGVEADLALAAERLLVRDVQLAEADAALEAAEAQRASSQLAAADAEAARDAALADRDAAAADRAAAVADRDAALLDRDAAVEERAEAQAQVAELAARTEELGAQVSGLADTIAVLEGEASRLEARATTLQQENVGLQARNDQLAAGNADLQARNASLQELNAALQEQIVVGNDQVRLLQVEVNRLNDRVEVEAARVREVEEEFARVSSGDITFERDQVVFSGALHARDVAEAREELAAFVRAASAHTASLGAGEVALSAEQFTGLVEVIAETEGSDLVRLISPRNQFNPARTEVTIEALENSRLFDAGQLLLSRPVHLGSPELPASQDEVRALIAQLKADVIRTLRRSGLDELQVPTFVGLSDEGFANQLLRLTGQVVVGVVAQGAIERAGPATVELVILY